jgi:hypothetical protein
MHDTMDAPLLKSYVVPNIHDCIIIEADVGPFTSRISRVVTREPTLVPSSIIFPVSKCAGSIKN